MPGLLVLLGKCRDLKRPKVSGLSSKVERSCEFGIVRFKTAYGVRVIDAGNYSAARDQLDARLRFSEEQMVQDCEA